MYLYPYRCHKSDNIKQNTASLNLFQTHSHFLHNTLQLNQCKLKIKTKINSYFTINKIIWHENIYYTYSNWRKVKSNPYTERMNKR